MKNKELEKKLLKLFSQFTGKAKADYLIEEIEANAITVREMEKSGESEVSFKNGCFTRFSKKALGTNKFIGFFNKQDGEIIRMICDGIFLARLNDRLFLCLVELKKNINNNFERVVKQVEGSYLKTSMLLSLLCNIKDIELAVFIGGRLEKIIDEPDIDYLEKVDEFRERGDNLESKLKEFSHNRNVLMNFPFFLETIIHENYRKKNVAVYHMGNGDTFDMQTL